MTVSSLGKWATLGEHCSVFTLVTKLITWLFRPLGAQTQFRPFHDYIDRTEYGNHATEKNKNYEEKKYNQQTLDLSALYRQPLLNYNINEVNEETLQV